MTEITGGAPLLGGWPSSVASITLRWETLAVNRCGCAPSRAFREGAGQTADTESRLRITRRRCWHPAALRRRGGDRKSKSPPVANARHASRPASKESPLSSPRSCQLDFLIGTKWGSNAGTKQKVPLRGAGPPFAEAAPPLRSLQGWEHNTYDAAGNRTSKTNYRNGLTSIRTMF